MKIPFLLCVVLVACQEPKLDFSNPLDPAEPGALPIAPTGLRVASIDSTTFSIHWHDGSSIETGFLLERASVEGDFFTIDTLSAGTTSVAINTHDTTTHYFYRVRAFTTSRVGPPSNPLLVAYSTGLINTWSVPTGPAYFTVHGDIIVYPFGLLSSYSIGSVRVPGMPVGVSRFSPSVIDGKYVYPLTSDGIEFIPNYPNNPFAVALSPGDSLFAASIIDSLYLWRIPIRSPMTRLKTSQIIYRFTFSSDSRFLAMYGHHGDVYVYDLIQQTLTPPIDAYELRSFNAHNDTLRLATYSSAKGLTIAAYDLTNDQIVSETTLPPYSSNDWNLSAFSLTGSLYAACDVNQSVVNIHDARTGQLLRTLATTGTVSFSFDETQILVHSGSTLQRWAVSGCWWDITPWFHH